MKPSRSLAIAALLIALGGCSKQDDGLAPDAPVAAVAPPAGRQWTETVAATPDGGFVMGNPDAPVKLVEYASFTCPHCALFSREATGPLKKTYVASGRVSWEFRSYLIHGPDAGVTLMVQCRGATPFFALAEQVFAAQDGWMAKLIAVPDAEQRAWQSLAPADQFRRIADVTGLRTFLAARGLPPAQGDACLADEKAADRLVQVRDHATNDLQVTGTPTFFINGQLQDNVANWAMLEERLKAAIG